jgi:putative ABC transport system permease protein
MSLRSRIRSWSRALRQRSRTEADMDAELRSHIESYAEDLIRSGIPRGEALRRARLEFGGIERVKEECRESRGVTFIESLLQDLRFGLRMLRKSPGFTAVAVLTLALGIGANAAIFALVKTMLLQPLPVRAANRLVVIWIDNLKNGWSRIGPTGQDYLDWKMQQKSFEDLFLFEHGSGTITGAGEPEQVSGLRVTTNFGDFFGIKPILGRTFRIDEAASPHNLAILSYAYWQRKFGGAPKVVGRGLILNGEAYMIIGVLPPDLSALFPFDVVVPFDDARLRTVDSDLGVFGRLRRGVTLKQASSEMNSIMQRIALQRPSRKDYGAFLLPLESARVEYIKPALVLLLCAVGFVLLIACANVANLLLSRSIGRQREVAVRMALGAGRVRLLQQFLAESTLLALLGGCGGVLLALWGNFVLARYMPSRIFVPNAADQISLPKTHLSVATFVFAVVISLLTGVIFGLIPAFQSLRCDFNESLKDGKRGSLSTHRGRRSRSALVVMEGALAFVLVIGAGLMLKSLSRLVATSPGFHPDHLLTLRIKLPNDAKDSKYREPRQQMAAFQNFLAQIEPLPGIQSAAFAEILPLSQDDMDMGNFVIQDEGPLPPGEHLAATFRDVSPNYFRTMGIPLIQGRTFTDQDNLSHSRVVIIDESFARNFFRNEDPIGHHLQIPNASAVPREIVGVVGGVLETGLDQQPRPTIYFPIGQTSDQTMSLVVRTSLPTATILPAIKIAIWSVDREQPVFEIRTMNQIISEITAAQRVASWALDIFAFLALALAAIGIYGVTSYAVSQRIHEVGIRMALGAQPADVMRLVLGQGLKLALLAVGTGVLASFALTRLMSSLLYGVSSTDPLTFIAVAILLALVALAACYIPARRAMKVDSMIALRYE